MTKFLPNFWKSCRAFLEVIMCAAIFCKCALMNSNVRQDPQWSIKGPEWNFWEQSSTTRSKRRPRKEQGVLKLIQELYEMVVTKNAKKLLLQVAEEDYSNIKSNKSLLSFGDAECNFNKPNRGSGYTKCEQCGCTFPIACRCCPRCGGPK